MSEPIIINSGEEGLSATDISMVIAGTAAALASIIYSLKHVKKSKCCGAVFTCEQDTECDEVEHTAVEQYKNETYV